MLLVTDVTHRTIEFLHCGPDGVGATGRSPLRRNPDSVTGSPGFSLTKRLNPGYGLRVFVTSVIHQLLVKSRKIPVN